jgi:DNA polymerase III alpha subunit
MVADHVTFGPRSAVREPAKAMGYQDEEIAKFVRLFRYGRFEEIPPAVMAAARELRGFPRYIGTHPGGVVIVPGPITRYTHVQRSPLGLPVIAWEKEGTEDAGLVKIDLLGNRSLGVLRDAMALVNPRIVSEAPRWDTSVVPARKPLDWESFCPLEDGETRRMIERGDTLGVFYVESPATRQLLRKMGTGDYPHLVIASSIIRPAANRSIEEYLRRLKGGSWESAHPSIDHVLRETLGIMVYQEDVSRIAIETCRFTQIGRAHV